MVYSFGDPIAVSTHKTQYFEIFGNRGIYTSRGQDRHILKGLKLQREE